MDDGGRSVLEVADTREGRALSLRGSGCIKETGFLETRSTLGCYGCGKLHEDGVKKPFAQKRLEKHTSEEDDQTNEGPSREKEKASKFSNLRRSTMLQRQSA